MMELSLSSISKTLAYSSNPSFITSGLHRRFPKVLFSQCLRYRLPSQNIYSHSFRGLSAVRSPILIRCFSSSAASFEAGGGGGGPSGEFGGGGGGGGDGSDANPKAVAAEEVAGSSADVIVLDVGVSVLSCFVLFCFRFLSRCSVFIWNVYLNLENGGQGMTCGGCAASVKRILESQVSVLLS